MHLHEIGGVEDMRFVHAAVSGMAGVVVSEDRRGDGEAVALAKGNGRPRHGG